MSIPTTIIVVLHTFPNQQEEVYQPLLGQTYLTGVSLQNAWNATHQQTARWVRGSAGAGMPWVVANDEQGSAATGVPPDPGYPGFTGKDNQGNPVQSLHDIRKLTLWGNLMAGGAGVEYYFGYVLPDNDLTLENFRSRDKSWDYARIALTFFRSEKIPFWEMSNADLLVGNSTNDNSAFGFAKAGEIYLVYLPNGGTAELDLTGVTGQFNVSWFDPRNGGALKRGSVASVAGGKRVSLGAAPASPGGRLARGRPPMSAGPESRKLRGVGIGAGYFAPFQYRSVDPDSGGRHCRDLQPHGRACPVPDGAIRHRPLLPGLEGHAGS